MKQQTSKKATTDCRVLCRCPVLSFVSLCLFGWATSWEQWAWWDTHTAAAAASLGRSQSSSSSMGGGKILSTSRRSFSLSWLRVCLLWCVCRLTFGDKSIICLWGFLRGDDAHFVVVAHFWFVARECCLNQLVCVSFEGKTKQSFGMNLRHFQRIQ